MCPRSACARSSRRRGWSCTASTPGEAALQRFVEGVLHLFGHPSELDRVAPGQAREILMQVVVEGVHRRSQAGPVVVWIDDLQWADPLLIELLGRLTRSLVDRPVLLVTAQRDDAEIDWPPASDHPITIQMPLDPLNREESDDAAPRRSGRPGRRWRWPPSSSSAAAEIHCSSRSSPRSLVTSRATRCCPDHSAP